MRRFLGRFGIVVAVAVVILLLLPQEKASPTGAWLAARGLTAKTVRVGTSDLRYVRKGAGPTIILIHGIASSIYSWADVIGPLSEHFDVIAVDLPGYGESTQPADLTFDAFEPALVGFMDALAVPRAHFAGNSLGGAISLMMAVRRPDRVDRLVLVDSAAFNMRLNERPFMIRVMGAEAAGMISDRLPIRRTLTRATLSRLLHDRSRVTDERVNEYVAPLLRPGALVATRSLLHSPIDDRIVAALGRIEAKTLVIWGRYDPWLPESHADRFVAAIRGARKVVVEAGHMPQEERPEEVAMLIRDFLIS